MVSEWGQPPGSAAGHQVMWSNSHMVKASDPLFPGVASAAFKQKKRQNWKRSAMMAWLAGLYIGGAGQVLATYQVQIDAPAPLQKLLSSYLDIARYQARSDISDEQFRFMLDTVEEQVKQLTATEGFFSPTTYASVEGEGNARRVKIRVEAGEQVKVHTLNLALQGAISTLPAQRDPLIKKWPLKPGSPFRQADWDQAKEETLLQMQSRRYFSARLLHSEARIYPLEATADLDALYDSGPLFTMGPLQISGLKRYPASVIHHVNPLKPGEEYSSERLLQLQRAIQNQPYFANVMVDMEGDPAHPLASPIHVRVTEYPVHRISAGAGYDTNTGYQVNGRHTYYNLFQRAWILSSQVRAEQFRQSGLVEMTLPPDARQYSHSVYAGLERTDLEGVDLRSLRAGAKRLQIRDEKYESAYTLDFYRDDLRPNSGERELNTALVPGYAWTRRKVDNPIFPRSGNIINLQGGFAVKGVLAAETFTRLYGRVRQYLPIGKHDLLIARAELGAILTTGSSRQVPATLRFRAGGTDSIRGYGYQSIGMPESSAQGSSVLPAKFLATAGLEYQHWLSQNWGGAVFYDAGSAVDTLSTVKIYQGVGLGVRWRSPVGPVHVDLAYGLENRQVRPHISLGIAF